MSIDTQLEELREQIRELSATPCGGCGHPKRDHGNWNGGRCAPVAAPCRCKQFVDPETVSSSEIQEQGETT